MKKYLCIALCVLLCMALAVPAFAESHAKSLEGAKLTESFSDDFEDDLDTGIWEPVMAVHTEDGFMYLGKGEGGWIQAGYAVYAYTDLDDGDSYVIEFDFTSNYSDCYFGVGIRSPEGTGANNNNGGRFGVPSASETGSGLSFDLGIKPKPNFIGVCLNNGTEYGDAAQFLVAFPDGYDGKSGHVKIVDTVDKVTLYINDIEVVTLELSELDFDVFNKVVAYDAAGEVLFEGPCELTSVNERFNFYQRNNVYGVDNFKISALTFPGEKPTEAPATEIPPTEAPTEAPAVTDAPAVTEAPKTTDAPKDNDNKNTDDAKKKNAWLVPVIVGCVVVVAAVVIAVIAASKKKKK